MLLTEDQRLTIKTNSPESKLYLSIYRPTTLLACRVNMASPAHGATAITFDGITDGAYTNVFKWATVLVGTEAGKDDIGTIWARSCTSTVLTVGINSIHWADNLYITVLNFVDIWNRPFSLELDGDEIVYSIDGDTAFTTEDIELGTFIKMGGNYAGFAGDQVYWDASESENVEDNSVSYVWEFEGGDISIHSGSTAGYVTYDTPGHYKTKLTATSSNDHVNVSYRYVSIYDPIGSNAPYEFVGADNFSGSREEGGWIVDAWIGEDEVPSIIKNIPAIVFARHNFGGTNSDIFKILFSGYVIEKNIRYSHISKTVECLLGSASEVMKLRPMTAVSVDSADTAEAWTQVSKMTVKKFLYYYLNYYTTALACFDVSVGDGFDTYVKYYETNNGWLYDNIDQIVNKSREGRAVFNREGIMYVEREPKSVNNFLSTVDETFELEDSDYLEEVYIEEKLENEMGSLQIGGFSFSGNESDETTPLLAQAPDDDYIFYSGDFTDKQGYAVSSQAELNQMAGTIYAYDNGKYQNVEITLFPLYLNFDIAPLESIPVSVSQSKNNAGVLWEQKKFYCKEMSIDLYNEQLSLVVKIILSEIIPLTYIYDGITIEVIPPMLEALPNIEIPDFEDYSWPGLTPFPFPNINPPYIPEPIDEDTGAGCPTDAPANGPYFLWSGILSNNTSVRKDAILDCVIRTSSYNNRTTYEINGRFQKWNSTTSEYEDTTDDFFVVKAYDVNNNLVATGVNDAVTSAYKRTGKLEAPAATEIRRIALVLNDSAVLRPANVVQENSADHGVVTSEPLTWGYDGSGIWVMQKEVINTDTFGNGPGTIKDPKTTARFIIYPESGDYIGQSFTGVQHVWFQVGLLDGYSKCEFGSLSSTHYTGSLGWKNLWGITYGNAQLCYPFPATGLYYEGPRTFNLTPYTINPSFAINTRINCIFNGNGTFKVRIAENLVYLYRTSQYKINITSSTLWNICPPGSV